MGATLLNISQYLRIVAFLLVPFMIIVCFIFESIFMKILSILDYDNSVNNILWLMRRQYDIFVIKKYIVYTSDFVIASFFFRGVILIAIIRVIIGIIFISHEDVSVNILQIRNMSYRKFLITIFTLCIINIFAVYDIDGLIAVPAFRFLLTHSSSVFLCLETVVLAGCIAFITEGAILLIWLQFRRRQP
jgi:hypothetical protein